MIETLFPTNTIKKSATISACGQYRYTLSRVWDASRPSTCWICLNPSTADADDDDPTIRKICKFTRSWDAGGIVVANLFAMRSTDPARLLDVSHDERVGPQNDVEILRAVQGAGRIIAAWGCHGAIGNRNRHVVSMLKGWKLECLAETKEGHPWHPLYLPDATRPFTWEAK